jgi:hypothetical protein
LARLFVEVETGKGSDALDRRPQLAAALSDIYFVSAASSREKYWRENPKILERKQAFAI